MSNASLPVSSPHDHLAEMREHVHDATGLLKTLANEMRLSILCMLCEGERSVGELNRQLNISQSALSQHLAVLRNADLVSTRRHSQVVYYRLTNSDATRVIQTLHDIYCPKPLDKARG
jgi:DNA-binding transcriptional ArsR family regulator